MTISRIKLSIKVQCRIPISVVTPTITTLGIVTLSRMTLSSRTFCRMILNKRHSAKWHSTKFSQQSWNQLIWVLCFSYYYTEQYSLQTDLKSAILLNVVAPFWNAVQIGAVAEEENTHGKRVGAPKEFST